MVLLPLFLISSCSLYHILSIIILFNTSSSRFSQTPTIQCFNFALVWISSGGRSYTFRDNIAQRICMGFRSGLNIVHFKNLIPRSSKNNCTETAVSMGALSCWNRMSSSAVDILVLWTGIHISFLAPFLNAAQSATKQNFSLLS